MTGVSMPVTRPTGRALIIGLPSCRSAPLNTLQRMGFTCAEIDDPYSAMAELCRRPLVYRAMILSLASFYREELAIIQSVKRRWPHVDVWLTQTDGRHAALADAMRLGADGLLSDDGLHRTAMTTGGPDALYSRPDASFGPTSVVAPTDTRDESSEDEFGGNEPILTAEELRALLAEQPLTIPEDEPE
jgi:DNA-binding NarL/FixJ family response regulator